MAIPTDEVQLVLPDGNELRLARGIGTEDRTLWIEHLSIDEDGWPREQPLGESIGLDPETLDRLLIALYRVRKSIHESATAAWRHPLDGLAAVEAEHPELAA